MSVTFELKDVGAGALAIATLDAEKSLNSLSLSMIENLYAKLREWSADAKIFGVLICGKGKAFCAGGDIRALFHSMTNKSGYVQDFFEKEYRLDCSLYSYPKPIVVWGHGITMGGGMGILQGARYRIVTDSTRMAMPEIGIGLIPDVGATYFLKDVPNGWGMFLALTGVRIKAADALVTNLADYWLDDSSLDKLLAHLDAGEYESAVELEKALNDFFNAQAKKEQDSEFLQHKAFVETVLKTSSAKEITNWAQNYAPQDEWEKTLVNNILRASPTSLALIYRLWEHGKTWSVNEAFYNEWFVASNCALKGDFQEGVRALLIDKDNAPKWNPPSVDQISDLHIDSFFASPRADGKNPLKDLRGE